MSEEVTSNTINKLDNINASQVIATPGSTVDEGQKSNQQQQQEVSPTTAQAASDCPNQVDESVNKVSHSQATVSQVSTDQTECNNLNNINDHQQLQVESAKTTKPVTDGQSAPTTANNSTDSTLTTTNTATTTTMTTATAAGVGEEVEMSGQESIANETTETTTTGGGLNYDPKSLMLWDSGVGHLPGSRLKFRMDEYGILEMIDDEAAEKIQKEHSEKKNSGDCSSSSSSITCTKNSNSLTNNNITNLPMDDLDDGTLAAGHSLCQNCGIRGLTSKFIRAGKFCSIECAKSSALTVKSLACGTNNADAGNYKSTVQTPHRTLNNHLYKGSNSSANATSSPLPELNNTTSNSNTNASIHGESILKKQTNNNFCPLQSPRQSSKLVNRPKLNLTDSNVDATTGVSSTTATTTATSKPNKRSIDSSDIHIASNGKSNHKVRSSSSSNKKSKLKNRHSLTLKSIESLVHENSISNLLDSNSITNDSEKLSLPSSPASSLVNITPRNALHQSIFTMKILQHQQEPPLGWDKHSKNLANIISTIKPSDVLKWNSAKVGEFVNSIPGCSDIGQCFMDEMIDGEAFLLLTQSDIVKVLNIKLGPAIKIHNTIILLRDAMEV